EHLGRHAAVAIVGGRQHHGVVAAVAGAGREAEGARAVVVIGEGDEGGQRVVGQGAGGRQGQRGAGGGVRGDRRLDNLAAGDRHGRDGIDFRPAVEVDHLDGHRDRSGQNRAGPVAVIGGGERHQARARGGEAGSPGEQGGVGVEVSAAGQVGGGVV